MNAYFFIVGTNDNPIYELDVAQSQRYDGKVLLFLLLSPFKPRHAFSTDPPMCNA